MKKVISCIMALMLFMFAAVPAFAATDDIKSPEGDLRYKVDVEQTTGGKGSYEITSDMNENREMGVHLDATADSDYKFDHWTIEGSYTTNGSLSDASLDIVITSDIVATPYFVKKNGPTDATQAGTTVVVQKDTSPSSPATGRNDAPMYVIVLFAAAVCIVAAVKFVRTK